MPTAVTIKMTEAEAIDIINALQKGIDEFTRSNEVSGACELLTLLRTTFQSAVKGLHHI